MNVHEALMSRLDFVFGEFERVVVSFSGGKDSGVLLAETLAYCKRNGLLGRLAVYHMDYEAQYSMTTEYVERTFAALPDEVTRYWVCLPVKAQCATSMFQTYWQPWRRDQRDIWCRQMPDGCINEDNFPWSFNYEVSDYEFNRRFGNALGREAKTCFLLGCRTDESLNRWRAVNSESNYKTCKGRKWTNTANGFATAWPLYDWAVEDVWTCNARYGHDYNRVYDLMWLAGLSPHQMRVASPFNDCATSSLRLYQVIEPDMWGRLVSRVNGVNFAGLYGGTTAMGWRKITKPDGMTWKDYMWFLLGTLPEETRKNYLAKLETSMRFWRERGGCLDEATIGRLREEGVSIEVGETTNYNTDKKPVRMEYLDDIDLPNFKEIPTYKRMCVCIMKNDHHCKYMGFSQTKDEVKRRNDIINKYRKLL